MTPRVLDRNASFTATASSHRRVCGKRMFCIAWSKEQRDSNKPSKVNEATRVATVPATVSAALTLPKPADPTSQVTAVLAIHDCVAHTGTEGIREDGVRSSTAKFTPNTVTTVDAVIAAFRGSNADIMGATRRTIGHKETQK